MENEYTEFEINTSLKDIQIAMRDAEDSAWEHAKESAMVLGIDLGSDEFVTVYNTLNERYKHQVEHLKFFMATAMITLKTMLESDMLSLRTDEKITEEEIAFRISKLSQSLVNSYMWLASGYEMTWLENKDLPEEIGIVFKVKTTDIDDESEDENGFYLQ